jgi:hypothetical protein
MGISWTLKPKFLSSKQLKKLRSQKLVSRKEGVRPERRGGGTEGNEYLEIVEVSKKYNKN